ncbi:alkyl/aryl-sulfatase [Actinocorallia libanotica]|uniref:Alkyl sulfatase dimerization domain-containing protein n=1 Tax=Actinocorallia libanotica TaxID=46162 RepID=A0ABN1QIZ4_9ACTN
MWWAFSFTQAANEAVLNELDFDDERDFADVARGLIAPLPDNGVIRNSAGQIVWDLPAFSLVRGDAPATANPSLWRQSKLMKHAGLFQVTDRLFQVRNHDLANVTIVEGDDALVVIDTGTNTDCARAAMDLYFQHRPRKPVTAVIYTHTHIDHYGGVLGIVSPEDVAAGKVSIIAPGDDFDRLALGENVICGNVMARRSTHPFGELLADCATGMIGDGIGLATASHVTIGYLPPTDIVHRTGEQRTLAGLTFVFQMAPDTEAPEEFHIFIPELKALTCAENANHTLHNIQTLRGARTRDAAGFARYLDEAIELFGTAAEVYYGPHTWPVWGNADVVAFLESQRDTYKYLHDQTLRLANHGLTPVEIAEQLRLPDSLGRAWWNRGYHGTVNHNVKAVYAKELGWYDGNPAHLHPLPPAESACRYVELAGGADKLLAHGRKAMEAGDYRWVAELAGHAVFADPADQKARDLQADAFEQLGYQAEGPQWRNIYLSAARELRYGVDRSAGEQTASTETIKAMPLEVFLDYLAVRLNGPDAIGHDLAINLTLTDLPDPYSITIGNGVLHARKRHTKNADLELTLTRPQLIAGVLSPGTLDTAINDASITAHGDIGALHTLIGLLDTFDPYFELLSSNAAATSHGSPRS